jgi:RNA-directed DNA polymerase
VLDGSYQPLPLRCKAIPKASGGERLLGIRSPGWGECRGAQEGRERPTVVDRLIQQAVAQVLTSIFDPGLSRWSFGFRPGRSAHQALRQVQTFLCEGYRIAVNLDLEKFLDPSTQCPPFHERISNRSGCVLSALIRKPFLLSWRT